MMWQLAMQAWLFMEASRMNRDFAETLSAPCETGVRARRRTP
ncbi:MAG TPA: hypothetical protein VM032_05915 [Vicinamibacterales bacterium]|nr:hypothetical protein [Vicinamibacterales bacterium]